jgi:hypothetical protein
MLNFMILRPAQLCRRILRPLIWRPEEVRIHDGALLCSWALGVTVGVRQRRHAFEKLNDSENPVLQRLTFGDSTPISEL